MRPAPLLEQETMLDNAKRKTLRNLLGQAVRFDEPLARHTSFRIGGPADILAQPEDREQLIALIQWAGRERIPYIVIGGGTNLLVRDGGFRGMVVQLQHMSGGVDWTYQGNRVEVTAGLGMSTRHLCRLALHHGWQGMNFAIGIPGTLGGALRMNAGTVKGCMADVLLSLTVLTARGEKLTLAGEEIEFGYHQMALPPSCQDRPEHPAILLAAEFRLQRGDRAELRREARQIMKSRTRQQPAGSLSAGCFFRNPSPGMPTGRLIEQAGFKGKRIGDAQVSTKHGNFIVNCGQARAAEILQLKQEIESEVWRRFGVRLEAEVQIVGQE